MVKRAVELVTHTHAFRVSQGNTPLAAARDEKQKGFSHEQNSGAASSLGPFPKRIILNGLGKGSLRLTMSAGRKKKDALMPA